jgi:4-aminobutyrate aminotransferase-like enzyme
MTLKNLYILCHGGTNHDRRRLFTILYVAQKLLADRGGRRVRHRNTAGLTCASGWRHAVFSSRLLSYGVVAVEFAPAAISTKDRWIVHFTPALALSTCAASRTGSETTEAAIKMAKCATGKFEIVAFSASYHGLTSGSGAATYSAGRRNGGPTMPGQLAFPAPYPYRSPFKKADGSYDWETELEFGWSMIDRQSVGSLAAFVMEPILSTGGILEPPKGYLTRMAEECKKRCMLLILDEAQTGIGRTGQMFAFEHEGIVPDILCLSKTLGCGLPLASVTTTAEVEQGCREAGFLWLTPHLNDPLTAAVGCKVLDIVERGTSLKKPLSVVKNCALVSRNFSKSTGVLATSVAAGFFKVLRLSVTRRPRHMALTLVRPF